MTLFDKEEIDEVLKTLRTFDEAQIGGLIAGLCEALSKPSGLPGIEIFRIVAAEARKG